MPVQFRLDMEKLKQTLVKIYSTIQTEEEKSYFLVHQVRYKIILETIEKLSDGKKLKILDIGCFPFHIGRVLQLVGHTVYGISSHHEPIQDKNIAILNIEEAQFPYKNNFFDLVLCSEVIEHLPHSPVFPLTQMYRVAKQNGFLIITTPNITRLINRVKLFFGISILYPIDVFFENNGRGNSLYHRHNREYTLHEAETLLKKIEWNIYQKKYTISYTPFRKKIVPDPFLLWIAKLVNYLCMRLVPSFSDTLFIIGKK